MLSILQKERRELRLLTMIMFLISSGAILTGMRIPQRASWSGPILTIGSLAESFWPLSIGIMAMIIGFRQGRAESTPDQIAMFMHRPWSRSYLIWRKFQAGWLALAISFVLPLIAAAVWQHAFTTVPLAAPLFILPGLALVSTVACHAAGIYAGAQPGRWYGLRVVPAMAALLMSDCAIVNWGMKHVALGDLVLRGCGTLLVSALLVFIAWRALLTQGDDDAAPRASDRTLSFVLCSLLGLALITTVRYSNLWVLHQMSYESLRYGNNGGVAVQHTTVTMNHGRQKTFRPFDADLDIDRRTAASAGQDRDSSWEFSSWDYSYDRPDRRFGPSLDLSTVIFNNDLVDAPFSRCAVVVLPCSGVLTTMLMPGKGTTVTDQAGQPLPTRVTYAAEQVMSFDPRLDKVSNCLFLCDRDGRPWWWISTEPYPVHVKGPWEHGNPIHIGFSMEDPSLPPRVVVVTEDGAHSYDVDGNEVDTLTVPGGLGEAAGGSFARRPTARC